MVRGKIKVVLGVIYHDQCPRYQDLESNQSASCVDQARHIAPPPPCRGNLTAAVHGEGVLYSPIVRQELGLERLEIG